jgi:glycosyltransferase involved in cell wall biosynthesis
LNQEFKAFEVEVIGDGCTDGSEEVARALNDPRLHWYNLPRNTGNQSEPNNEGLRRARGRYVAFIGHDDLWFPWHLERLVAHAEKTSADLVHDLAASMTPEGVEAAHGAPNPQSGYSRIYVPTSSWLHRRELANEIGFWRDPDKLAWPIDFDFTRRAAIAGKKMKFVESLGVLKFHSANWKLYSRTGTPPQQACWEEMLESSTKLSERILTQLATRYAHICQFQDKIPFSLAWRNARTGARSALKAAVRDLVYGYGHDRWPAGPLLRQRARVLRSRFRVVRGLAPLTNRQIAGTGTAVES